MKPFYVKAMTTAALAACLFSTSALSAFAAENEPAQQELTSQTPQKDIEPEERNLCELQQVSKYRLEPGKYYMAMREIGEVHNRRARPSYEVLKIKVLRSYEKDRWIGTVRTADVKDCKTGEIKELNCDEYAFYALN